MISPLRSKALRGIARAGAMALIAGIAVTSVPGLPRAEPEKALAPIPPATVAIMTAKGTSAAAPLVLRSYKKEAEIEVWKQNSEGRFVFIKTFPICRWSGQLGPKHHSGDRQTPEGFYPVGSRQMNPNSHYYLSFDTGFPNAYDRAHGATGSAVMVHGTCSSMGCFAMTDKSVGEIYAIARDALKGGQPAFQLQAYPFHMTAKNMALYRNDPNIDFWRQLKEGSDRFESTGELLGVSVVDGRYAFAPSKNAAKERAAQSFHVGELAAVTSLVQDGAAAVRTTYADGGQNAIFAALLKRGADLGTVSRPEALAYAGIDVTLIPARRRPTVNVATSTSPTTPSAVVKADWAPELRLVQSATLKTHPASIPTILDAAALGASPMHYALYKPPQVVALITGAMPMRLPTWTN